MSSSSSSPMTMNLSDESSRRDILDAAMRYLPENQSSASRNLKAYPPIAGYQPISQVGDHNRLDLDQDGMKILLFGNTRNFTQARNFYEEGGFSRPFAELTLVAAGGNLARIRKGTTVKGKSAIGMDIDGIVMEDVDLGSTSVRILYPVAFADPTACQVGGLSKIGSASIGGCFEEQGTLHFETGGSFKYTYDVLNDNKNNRTIQQFSKNAEDDMLLCGDSDCPNPTFRKYFEYYKVPDYGDRWVVSAFEKTKTAVHLGVADFADFPNDGRAEAIHLGTLLLHVWMHVVYQLEDAIDRCYEKRGYSVHAWDQAVSFYTGSLEGKTGTGAGAMLYSLSQKLCTEFKTCGDSGTNVTGRAFTNYEVFRQFEYGQTNLTASDCVAAEQNKNAITQIMIVPLVQGTMSFAFIREMLQDSDKAQGAAATFAAAVVPLVHHCSPNDAELIYKMLEIGSATPTFVAVKTILERHYDCMGITCAQVGGLLNHDKEVYFEDAAPCTMLPLQLNQNESTNKGLRIAMGILLVCAVPAVFLVYAWRQKRRVNKNERKQQRLRGLRGSVMDPAEVFASSRQIDPDDLVFY